MVATSIEVSVSECSYMGATGRGRERERGRKTGKNIKRCTILSRFVINENKKKWKWKAFHRTPRDGIFFAHLKFSLSSSSTLPVSL